MIPQEDFRHDEHPAGDLSRLIPDLHVKMVCKPGSPATCRFLVMGASGFECAKWSVHHDLLNDRVEQGQMVARGDNCGGVYQLAFFGPPPGELKE